ncbi:monooxygenase [Kitasatospora sp. NPDC050543]|uniref:monooxygenase n=1 Tax=Kitasatospora sp. NPDC050543 TaxID=3364054 RepID=UPI0037880BB6
MRDGTVAVIGGSIAGCAFAAAAARGGARQIVVLERTPGRLADRGVGLCVHNDRYAELAAAGALDPDIAWHRLTCRRWLVKDGSRLGRVMWDQPFPFRSYHWGLLWQGLRRLTPETVDYRPGSTVTGVGTDAAGALVEPATGSTERFDLVVGADGYRSVVRDAVCPGARPRYAGYICWRGSFPAARLAELHPSPGGSGRSADGGPTEAWPSTDATTIGFPGGQCILYRIPGPEPEGPVVNWVLYAEPPTAGLRLDDPTSIPPGTLADELTDHLGELADRHLPPYWAAVLGLTPRERTFVQPIYDLETPRRTAGRLLLAGDAATVVRPHNTSGAAKALQDACAFETAWRAADSWAELLSAYESARGEDGRALVSLGRRLGRAQVERTPHWPSMDSARMASWWEQQLAGTVGFGGQSLAPGAADHPAPQGG